MFSAEVIFFTCFTLMIVLMLALDLGVFSKENHVVKFKEAAGWTSVWVALAMGFYFFITQYGYLIHDVTTLVDLTRIKLLYGHDFDINYLSLSESLANYQKAIGIEYLTGYLLEYSLSIDNIFVIVLVFSAFGVHEKYFHKILFWGILGAVVFRFLFIFLGAALITRFEWILYLFGLFLVYSGVMMYVKRNSADKVDSENHPVIKFASKYLSVSKTAKDGAFFVVENGKRFVTPLFLVLLVVEFTDLIFAVDSIPAIFGVTKDPYIVFFSNIFAILGLRSLFFLLMNVIHKFRFLKVGLAVLLIFIGVKMLAHHYLTEWGFTTAHSLYVIVGILGGSVVASILFPEKEKVSK